MSVVGKNLLVAGGGTGGHLFSGLAVAEEWVAKGGHVNFVGTQLGIEINLVPQYGYKLETINVKSIKGNNIFSKIKSFLMVPRAMMQSLSIIKKTKPDYILGIGGYASGPTVMCGKIMGIPTGIIDQNSIPGFTNRILGKFAGRVFLNYDRAASYFNPSRVIQSGNPVLKARIPEKNSYIPKLCLLICGGSQGAHAVNDKMMQAISLVISKIPNVEVIHQTGKADFESVKKFYDSLPIKSEVAPFFNEMGALYKRAGLVVARSGAGTTTELALWGMPSILIPFPFAADDHQKYNAKELAQKGAAIILEQSELTAENLSLQIIETLTNEDKLRKMSQAAFAIGKPNASKDIVKIIEGQI